MAPPYDPRPEEDRALFLSGAGIEFIVGALTTLFLRIWAG